MKQSPGLAVTSLLRQLGSRGPLNFELLWKTVSLQMQLENFQYKIGKIHPTLFAFGNGADFGYQFEGIDTVVNDHYN